MDVAHGWIICIAVAMVWARLRCDARGDQPLDRFALAGFSDSFRLPWCCSCRAFAFWGCRRFDGRPQVWLDAGRVEAGNDSWNPAFSDCLLIVHRASMGYELDSHRTLDRHESASQRIRLSAPWRSRSTSVVNLKLPLMAACLEGLSI